MTQPTSHIWIPNREIVPPPPQKFLFPARRQVDGASCMPSALMMQRMPLKPMAFDFGAMGVLIMDLRSDAGTNQSAGGAAATATNDPVGEWVDQTGNGNTPTEATNKPTLQLAQLNGYPSVRFDGSNDKLQKSFTLDAPFVYYAVMNQITWTDNDKVISDMNGNFDFFQRTSTPTFGIWKGDSVGFNNSDLAVATWGIVEVKMGTGGSGEKVGIRVNAGTSSESGTTAPSMARAGISIAAHSSAANFCNVEFARILLYTGNMTVANADIIFDALNDIYAVY